MGGYETHAKSARSTLLSLQRVALTWLAWTLESETLGTKPCLDFPAVWLWARYLTALSFSFLIYKMGVI